MSFLDIDSSGLKGTLISFLESTVQRSKYTLVEKMPIQVVSRKCEEINHRQGEHNGNL